jgi:hypothetical protein
MKHLLIISSIIILSTLSACSKEQNQAANDATTAKPQTTTAPAAPQSLQGNIPKSGKVVKAMHAGGYTYMEMENGGKVFWVAATMMNVKKNDQVAWADAALMQNFNSPSLRRTFPEILFVSNASIQ